MTEIASDVGNATIPTLQGDNFDIVTNESMLQKLNDEEIKVLLPTIIYLALLSVIGIIGNSLVCHVYRTRYRRSNYQCFILCLSVIDLFSCCIAIPLDITTMMDQYTFEYEWLCKLSRFLSSLGTSSSSFLLLFTAIDRYRKVCQPFGWQIKASVAKLLCVLSVLFGSLISWTAIFLYGKQTNELPELGLTGTYCSIDDAMLNTNFPLISSAFYSGCVIVGSLSIFILYCFIFLEVKRHAKMMQKDRCIRNTFVPRLSATIDRQGSIISDKIKWDSTKKSFSKRRSRKADSEGSWTDRNFELACSMDSTVKNTSIVLTDNAKEQGEDLQSVGSSGIKSDQANKDENVENCKKGNVKNREVNDRDIENADCEGGIICTSGIKNSVDLEIQNKLNNLLPVKEDDYSSDQTPKPETHTKQNRILKPSSVETKRKTSKLSKSSESMKTRYTRAGMSSLVTGKSTGSATIKTHKYKQALARKTAFLVFIISIAFILSYTPHLLLRIVTQLVNNFADNMTNDGRAVYNFFLRSFFINSAINPVIYGVYDSRFRTACQDIFSLCYRPRQPCDFN